MPISEVNNQDCMIGMKTFPDKFFDLAIVDPPFFSGPNKANYYRGGNQKHYNNYKEIGTWENPEQGYFDELLRISKNQIIWGINYYQISFLGTGRIVWDKKNDIEGNDFSDCEIAYCSCIKHVRIFRYLWNGFLQEKQKGGRELKIHPTQKPLSLYNYCLGYAKPGDKILDTHLGSQSSRIAAYKLGFDFWGYEIDEDYFKQGCERFNKAIAEPLFEQLKPIQGKLI